MARCIYLEKRRLQPDGEGGVCKVADGAEGQGPHDRQIHHRQARRDKETAANPAWGHQAQL